MTIQDTSLLDLYTDGGVIGKNPSKHGGTWAWCLVNPKANNRLAYEKGIITPIDLGLEVVTNNVSELYAAVQGLTAMWKMDRNWSGFIWTDSQITIYRLSSSLKFNGIPDNLKEKCLALRKNAKWTPMLCNGHPTKKDLEVGYSPRGRPVSRHNVFVDKCCTKLAKKYLSNLNGDHTRGEN